MVTIATDPCIKHLQKLLTHCKHVRENCEQLGTFLIEQGEVDIGRVVIANGLRHDASKFEGIEWEHLWCPQDPLFREAWQHHISVNDHHPEKWGHISNMPREFLAECVCDWAARSSEFGSALRPWIEQKAMEKFHFGMQDRVYEEIEYFLSLLLEPAFV